MKIIADRKPLVSEVDSWDRTFHSPDGSVKIYEASNYYDYFKCTVKDQRPKYFFGESAWMNAQRFAVDNSDFSAYNIFN